MSTKTFQIKTPEQVRDDFLRTLSGGLRKIGVQNPNVSEGTKDWITATFAGTLAGDIYLNNQLGLDAQLPDTAQGDDFLRLARQKGLTLQAAGPSQGFAVLSAVTNSPILIPTGSTFQDQNGLKYSILIGGPFSNGELMQIISVSTGSATNLAAGSVLKWTNPPPFANSTALVATGGLSGGVDSETIEQLRARYFERTRNSPRSSNWASLAASAEKATTFVRKAFVYPGVYGGSSAHLAVLGRPTASNKDCVIDPVIISQFVEPLVRNEQPEHSDLIITGIEATGVSVCIGLKIPDSIRATPPGAGGGWIDSVPWPVMTGTGSTQDEVIINSVHNSGEYTVLCDKDPSVGDSFCYVSPEFRFYQTQVKQIVSAADVSLPQGTRRTVRFKTSTPLYSAISTATPAAIGNPFWPACENAEDYVNSIYSSFENVGPTEKTTTISFLNWAYRRPQKEKSFPDQVNVAFLRALKVFTEVEDADFILTPDTVVENVIYQQKPTLAVPEFISFYPLTN